MTRRAGRGMTNYKGRKDKRREEAGIRPLLLLFSCSPTSLLNRNKSLQVLNRVPFLMRINEKCESRASPSYNEKEMGT